MEFHEMNDLNVRQEEEPDPEKETSFTNAAPFDRHITEVNDLNTRVDKSVEEIRSIQTESERALSDNLESLKELVQKQKAKNVGRKAERLSEIIRLRKKKDRLTKQENIELKEIADENPEKSKQSESVKERYMESVRREKKERLELTRIQKKLDELDEQEEDPDLDDEKETSFINDGFYPAERTDQENREYTKVDYIDRDISRTVAIRNILINFLDLEPQCGDPKFVDYLIDINVLGNDFGLVATGMSDERIVLLRSTIRDVYDEWAENERKKVLKKAGIATAIGLIALITGLSVGLTRKGADIVHQAKKWEKLTPAKKISESIPWTKLEKATGTLFIFTGEHIVIIITLVGIYIYEK